jgi:serine O-acetyltransferase
MTVMSLSRAISQQNQSVPTRVDAEADTWAQLRAAAEAGAMAEPTLASLLHATILNHKTLAAALSYHLAQKLAGADMNALQWRELCEQAFVASPDLVLSAERDMLATLERDPASRSLLQPFLYFKGFQALQTWRVAHWLWNAGRDLIAFHLQSRISELYAVDIHPAAVIGSGVMIDHATAVVIGETARIGDDCSILHNVTLGGTGNETGDRHPKIGRGVLIGAGAKVLGNITVGDEARIAAGSVVLTSVAARCTVAGVPARPVGGVCVEPARTMRQIVEAEALDPGI